MGEKEEIELSPETVAMLSKPVDPNCPLCEWILQDFEFHGKLTDWPFDYTEKGIFPVSGKVKHVQILKKIEEGRREEPKRKAPAPKANGGAGRPAVRS